MLRFMGSQRVRHNWVTKMWYRNGQIYSNQSINFIRTRALLESFLLRDVASVPQTVLYT